VVDGTEVVRPYASLVLDLVLRDPFRYSDFGVVGTLLLPWVGMLQSQHRISCLLGVGRGWWAKQEEKAGVDVVDAEDFVEPRLRLG
jgi:hypothetical protein